MKYFAMMFAAAAVTLLAAFGAASVVEPHPAQAATYQAAKCGGGTISLNPDEHRIFVLQNRARLNHGLRRLCVHPKLLKAARAHSADMVNRNYFSHDTKGTNQTFSQRITSFGYNWRTCGENITWGSGPYGSPDSRFRAWMNSPEHRANILNGNFHEVGIGVVHAQHYQGYDNANVYTADFGTR